MNNKIAVVTGASRGLGRSIALHLARKGAGVIGTYRSRADEAQSLVDEIESLGGQAVMIELDVGDAGEFGAFKQRVCTKLASKFQRERFDFLVNNAGIGLRASFEETSEEQLDQLLAIHVKAPFLLSQALLPLIEDGGRILNVSSGLARFTIPGYAAYAAAKGAVEVLTRYMAQELGPRGIRVNVIAPGAIETDFGGGAVRDNPEVNAMIARTVALGRAGLPDDVGGAVAAILSDDFGWANGIRIEVSGGQNL
jgi:NAD(P)-dependent dehydrogenase (short-subunit alcohol dehydrogenase family)